MGSPNTKVIDADQPKAFTDTEGLVSISQAAQILDVSIDTVRRWDKQGILKSTRPDGKNRYFSVKDLEVIKFAQPLSISEVSEQLNISPSTLRRLEAKGLISPERNEQGERVYDRKSLENFLRSQYFLRQKEVEQEILQPLNGKPEDKEVNGNGNGNGHHDPTTHALLGEHHIDLANLKKFKKYILQAVTVLGIAFVSIVALITILFFLFPEGTSKTLGYYKRDPLSKHFVYQDPDSWLARGLKPFSQTALRVVEVVNAEQRKRVAPFGAIEDVNDVFKPDAEGNVASVYTFTVPDTSYLVIPDTGLIKNLNGEFVQGRKPGCEQGDLAIVGQCSPSSIATAPSTGGGGTTVVNTTTTGGGDITEVIAGVGLSGGGEEGSVTLNVGVGDGLSSGADIISLSLQSGGGLQTSSSGLSLDRTCANNEILKWNGSAWVCAADGGGGGGSQNLFESVAGDGGTNAVADSTTDTLTIAGGNGLTSTGTAASDTITLNIGAGNGISVGTDTIAVSLQVNKGLEVDGNGVSLIDCGDNEILKYSTGTGFWSCQADAGSSSINVQEQDITISSASTFDFLGADFTVTDSPAGEANISIDYANSGITRANQSQTITGAWNFVDANFRLQDDAGSTKQLVFELSGITAGTTRTLSIDDHSGTLVVTPTAATSGQLVVADGSGIPQFVTLSGDATLGAGGVIDLADTTVTTGTYGSASQVGQFTVDSEGRITAAGNLAIAIDESAVTGEIESVTAGLGLTGGASAGAASLDIISANGGIVVNSDNIALTIQSNKGLEVDASGLSLVDCGNNQVLKYSTGTSTWTCQADTDTDTDTTNFTVSGDTGSQTINAADILTIAGGAGISSAASATDLVTLTIGAGNGISVTADSVGVSIQANKGLEVDGNGVSLIDCANNEILKYSTGSNTWSCQADNTGSSAFTVKESDGTPSVSSVNTIEFGPAAASSDEFVITDQTGGTVRVTIGNQVAKLNEAEIITGGWTFNTNPTTFTTNIVANGGLSCTDCIALGSETTGDYLSTLTAGNGIATTGAASGEGIGHTLSVNTLSAGDGTGAISSFSGFEFAGGSSNQLSLLQGCADNQVLKWDNTNSVWACSSDVDTDTTLFSAAGDGGVNQVINAGDILSITGGDGVTTTALATDTVRVDVGAGNGIAVSANSVAVNVQANKGLEADGSGLSLVDCGNNQVLKYSTGTSTWTCQADVDTDTDTTNFSVAGDTGSQTINATDVLSILGGAGLTSAAAATDTLTLTIGAGNGISVAADSVAVSVQANKGLEVDGSGVSLVDCGNNQILKYSTATNTWTCQVDTDTDTTNFMVAGDSGPAQTINATDALTIAGGNGLTSTASATDILTLAVGAGNGITVNANDVAVKLETTADGGLTASVSGMEVTSGGLALLQGCSADQVLKWNTSISQWNCAADNGGSGSSAFSVEDANTLVSSSITTLDFGDDTDDFIVNQTPAGEANVKIDYTTSGITRRGQNETISGDWTFSSATPITLTHATPVLTMANGSTLAVKDAVGNTMLSLVDTGTTGDLTISGDTTISGNDLTFGNGESISNTTNSTITFGRNDAGTVTLTAKDDNSNADLVLTPGGAAGLTLGTTGGGGTTSITLATDGTGNAEVVLPDGSISSLEILDSTIAEADLDVLDGPGDEECLTYEGSTAQFEWQSCGSGGAGSSVWSDLTAPNQALSLDHAEFGTTFTWNTAATAAAINGLTLALTNDSTADSATQRVLVVKNNNATGGTTEDLIFVENADDNTVTNGVIVTSTGGGSITNAFNASDANILNALNIGPNRILGTIGTIDFDNFDVDANGTVTIAANQAFTGVDATFFKSGGGGDMVLDASSNEVRFTDVDVLHIGGLNNETLTYNALANSGGAASHTAAGEITADNDLYIQDDLEVDGTLFVDGLLIDASTVTTFNCLDCIDYDDMENTLDVDEATNTNLAGNNLKTTLNGAGNLIFDLNGTTIGDILIQEDGVTFITIAEDGTTTIADDTDFSLAAAENVTISNTTATVDAFTVTHSGVGNDGVSITFTQTDDADASDITAGLRLSAVSSSADADSFVAIDIDNLTGGAASEIAARIGTGWDVDLQFNDPSAVVQFNNAGSIAFGDNSSVTGVAVLTLQDTATNAANHLLTVDSNTALSFSGNDSSDQADITTISGEDLTIIPTGAASTLFRADSDTNIQILTTSTGGAPGLDMLSISNGGTGGQPSATNGVDGLQITFGASGVSGNVVDLTPSFAGGSSDALSYNVIDIDAFSPTNSTGTDTVQALNVGNLTDPGTTITSIASNIGTGWDVDLRFNDASAVVQFNNAGTLAFGDNSSVAGVAVLTLQDTATNNGHHILTVDSDTALQFSGNDSSDQPDITTISGEDLTITPLGAASTLFRVDSDTNVQVLTTAAGGAPGLDLLTINNSAQASTTSGVDGLYISHASSNASGDAIHLTASFVGGATDALTYNAFELDAFTPTNGSGTDTVRGLQLGNLTDPGATISSFGANIGTGWDVDLRFNDASTVVQFAEAGTLAFGDNSSVAGVAVLTLQDTATNAANHLLTVDPNTALQFSSGSATDTAEADIRTGTNEDLTIIPNGDGDVVIDTDADTQLILNGGGDNVDSLVLTDGDILVMDGDLDLSGGDFNVILDAADTANITSNAAATADGLLVTHTGIGNDGVTIAFTQTDDADGGESTAGLRLSGTSSSADADIFIGLDIDTLAAGAASEIATRVGSGWDVDLRFVDASAAVQIADSGTITFEDSSALNGVDILTLQDVGNVANHVLSIDDNTALTFSGNTGLANQDITTGTNEDLTIRPNGSGDVIFNLDGDTNANFTASAAPGVDMVVINNSAQPSTTSGVDGLYISHASSNASGAAIHITPSFAGGATDNLTYNIIATDAFSSTNAAGTDNINGILIGALTEGADASRLASTALNISGGWDTGIKFGTTITKDIQLQNGATVDNNASGIILLTATTTQASNILLVGLDDGNANEYLSFSEDPGNPTGCASGEYRIWANESDGLLKKCQNGALSDLDAAGAWSAITAPTGDLNLTGGSSHQENITSFEWSTDTTADVKDYFTLAVSNDATTDSGAQRLMVLRNNDDGAISTGITDALLVIDHADTNETLPDGILFNAATVLTDAIDLSDSEIVNALNLGDNIVTGGDWTIINTTDIAEGLTFTLAGGVGFDITGTAGQDFRVTNTGGSIVMTATESAADSIKFESTTGGIDILASGAAAGEDIDIVATGSSINVQATESITDAIVINASGAAGGIDLISGSSGILLDNPTGAGNIVLETDGDSNVQINAVAAPTTDVISITNAGFGTTTTAIDAASITFETAGTTASADNAALRVTVTSNNSGTTTTLEGIDITALASAEANSTETAIRIGTGWDNIIDGVGFDVVNTTGATTIAGSADGTDAFTITAGDILVSNGDFDMSGGDFNVTLDAADGALFTSAGTPTSDVLTVTTTATGAQATAIDGIQIDFETDGTTASADNAALRVNVTSNNSGTTTTLEGIDITALASAEANSTETALRIGSGWDVDLSFTDSNTVIRFADGAGNDITFEDSAGNDVLVLEDIGSVTNHILSIDADTGLAFDSAADSDTDITTATNEALRIVPNGTGDLVVALDSDTNAQFSAALTTDATINSVEIILSAGGSGSTGTLNGLLISQADTGTTGVYDSLVRIQNLKTPETTTNGLIIENNAASSVMTNGISITNTAGTLTNGLIFTGTIGTDIATASGRALTIESGTTGTITIGGDTNAETLNFGTGGAAKTINIGTVSGGNITVSTSGTASFGTSSTTAGSLVIDGVLASSNNGNNVCNNSTSGNWSQSNVACAQVSSSRFKHDIVYLDNALDMVKALRPVSYAYNEDNTLHYGFIAEDANEIPELQRAVVYDDDGQISGLVYMEFMALIAGGVKELDNKVDVNALTASEGLQSLEDAYSNGFKQLTDQLAMLDTRVTNLENQSQPPAEPQTSSANSDQVVAAEIGQRYYTDDSSINTGDVVMLDPAATGKVKKADAPYSGTLIGVVTTAPGILMDAEGSGPSVIVAAAGKVSVKVSIENGAIQAGDALTASSVPGVAMKATQTGKPIIGRATMGYSGEGVSSVVVLVDNGFSVNDISDDLAGLTTRLNDMEGRLSTVEAGQQTTESQTGTTTANGEDIDLSNLTVGYLTVDMDLMVNGALVVNGNAQFHGTALFDQLVTFGDSILVEGDATFNRDVAVKGTLTVNNNTAGYAVIKPGEDKIRIIFSQPYESIPVITLSLGDGKFATYSYRDATKEGFEIILKDPATEELKFSWHAASVNNAQTYINAP